MRLFGAVFALILVDYPEMSASIFRIGNYSKGGALFTTGTLSEKTTTDNSLTADY